MTRLSVCLITKNAEDKVETCLKSVAGWADEVLVLDGESTDRTVEICKKYTDKIFIKPFSGSFSEERNFLARQAQGEWILHLDADERVPEEFKKEFEEKSKNLNVACYKTLRKNFFLGKAMIYGPWYHYIHILHRKKQAHFIGKVHERLQVQGEIGIFDSPIEHYPFHSISEFMTRQNRYTSLCAEEIFETHGKLPWKKIRKHFYYKPAKLFYKNYVRKKAYKEGFHGLVFSALYSFEHFLKWAKYWEKIKSETLQRERGGDGGDENFGSRGELSVGGTFDNSNF